jgi:hypothetical protein
MRAIDYPLRENITGSGDDLGWVKYAKGSAVSENQTDHSRYTLWVRRRLTSRARCSKRSLESDPRRHARRTSRLGRHGDFQQQNQSKEPPEGPLLRRESGSRPHLFPGGKVGSSGRRARKKKKTNWSAFGDVTNIYSLCFGLAHPGHISEFSSALFCLCGKKYTCSCDGLMMGRVSGPGEREREGEEREN